MARFEKIKPSVDKQKEEGRLAAWEAYFDIVNNGENPRVVLVRNGECGSRLKFSRNDPTFGVLRPNELEVDERYRNLAHAPGDLFRYKGRTYVMVWSAVPAGTLANPAGPRGKRYEGYLLVQSLYWTQNTAGVFDTVCQFSYGSIVSHKK